MKFLTRFRQALIESSARDCERTGRRYSEERRKRSARIAASRSARAFTLVELVVVIVVIGLLALFGGVSMAAAAERAKVSVLDASLKGAEREARILYAASDGHDAYAAGSDAAADAAGDAHSSEVEVTASGLTLRAEGWGRCRALTLSVSGSSDPQDCAPSGGPTSTVPSEPEPPAACLVASPSVLADGTAVTYLDVSVVVDCAPRPVELVLTVSASPGVSLYVPHSLDPVQLSMTETVGFPNDCNGWGTPEVTCTATGPGPVGDEDGYFSAARRLALVGSGGSAELVVTACVAGHCTTTVSDVSYLPYSY